MTASRTDTNPLLLLVDDAPTIHRLLAVKLKDEGLEFLAAFSGEEALELAQTHSPSLILLDMVMPGMGGIETLRELKGDARTMDIPVIILSGNNDAELKVAAFDSGAMDYVTKPFDVHELQARIRSALRMYTLVRLLEQRAQIDAMTGLWNRMYFNERLGAELANAERSGSPLALVLCDMDHFKAINDRFGHLAGDAVLQTFASMFAHELRVYDVACRFGGEEFALILPGATAEEAVAVCERLRRALQVRTFRKYPELTATVSFGVTDGAVEGTAGAPGWVEAADRALYSAKQSGRNRVHVYDPRDGSGRAFRLAS